MGVRAGPGWGEELHRQDELLAWHRLELRPRRPTHHYDMSHPQHPRDPQRHCQHLLSHSVNAFPGFYNTLPSVQPLFPTRRGSTSSASPLPLLLGLLHTLLINKRGLPPQLPNGSELRPAHPVTVHQEGLKMKVRQKLKSEPEEGGAFEPNLSIKRELEDLTPEDEDRRRRRRERNKVAATKCRNKKKEKTTILVAESEIVEVQNASLKAEVARLDAEKRRLTTILAQHAPNCAKKRRLCTGTEEVPPTTSTSQEEQYDMSHTFRRPAAPGSENSRGSFGPSSQEQHSYGGYSTNRAGEGCHNKKEDEVEDHNGHFAFKSEAKDYNKYSSGEMYDSVYNLMRQPQAALAEYSSSRGVSYAGGYYDHMCLAL